MQFKLEKDLVKELVLLLKKDFNINHLSLEFRSGSNICDVVFTDGFKRKNVIFDNYFESYFYFNKILKNKKININEIKTDNYKSIVSSLNKHKYIKVTESELKLIEKVSISTNHIHAIEAKLSDWKNGLKQALTYKEYADYVYVAISKEYYKNIDLEIFKNNNVGLILVEKGKLTTIFKPTLIKGHALDIKYYIADKLLKEYIQLNPLMG